MLNKDKRTLRAGNPLFVAIASALICGSAGISAAPIQSGDHYLVVPSGSYDRLEAGRQLMHDYGSFQLWRMDGGHAAEIRSAASKDVQPVDTGIAFEAGAFDPLNQRFAAPAVHGFQLVKPTDFSIELVQFMGPIADAWEKQLSATGVKVLQYIPNNAYAVLADAEGRAALGEFQRSNSVVRVAETLQPIYKLAGGLPARARAGLDGTKELDVTVMLAKHASNGNSKAAIQALNLAGTSPRWANSLEFETLRLRVRETDIEKLAQIADVFAIGPYYAPERMDEIQGQIIAGNTSIDGSGDVQPSGIGYRAWLTSRGFSTNPADYPIVDVVDDGLGTGIAANGAGDETLTLNGDGVTTRVQSIFNCTADAAGAGFAGGDSGDGHGHINVSIVGGYDDRGDAVGIQFPFEDLGGYLRGQGINPWARLAGTKIFGRGTIGGKGAYSIVNCANTDEGVIRSSQDRGAAITSNSWGCGNPACLADNYDASSRAYDIGTRDSDLVQAGLQPMIHIFAAGNGGSGASTVGTPGAAKNVITVGASENYRESDESGAWTDGCGTGPTGADDAMDIIGFSSRGPVEGGRIKPELIAPGTHIHGTASSSPNYDGTGTCDQFRPGAQTVFAASSGTSHSTPAIAGVTSLVYRYLQTSYGITPSAAMAKAYLMAHPTYLTGVSGNGNLPTNAQGFGMPNLGGAFDATTDRVLRDQQDVLDATGQIATFNRNVQSTGKPLRIALAWSDAPGPVAADPKVNNLNLEVDVGGNTYRGNVFTGQFSSTGGVADANNNYEAVFLPAGISGPIQIRVIGANIPGDGIPGSGDGTDQDFALVCSNCVQVPDFLLAAPAIDATTCGADGASWATTVTPQGGYSGTVNLSASSVPTGGTPSFVPVSGTPQFNSTFSLSTAGIASGLYLISVNGTDGVLTRSTTVSLQHDAAAPTATTLTSPANGAAGFLGAPSLQWNAIAGVSSYVVELDNDAGFGSIDYTATVSGTSHTPVFSPAALTQYFWRVRGLNLCGPGANSNVFSFTTADAYCANPVAPIPDNNAAGVTSAITIPTGASITDLDVVFEARHTWIGDLSATLTRAAGVPRTLIDRPGFTGTGFGCSGDNSSIVLDDEAATAVETTCNNANPGYPVGARRTPNETFGAFDGLGFAATWTLTVRDSAPSDTGFLDRWCLVPTQAAVPVDAVADTFAVTEDVQFNQGAPGVLANDMGTPLTASVVTPPVNGNLTLNGNGSFSYLPSSNACGGAESFVYQATDGATMDTATATLNISCVNDLPVAVNDAYNGFEDTPVVVAQAQGVLINDTDVDSNPLTAVSASDPPNGSVVLNTNGSFTYTPDANYCNVVTPDTFTYSANDGTINSAVPATVGVTVACVNDLPVAVADVGTVAEGGTLTVTAAAGVLSNDSDADGSALTAVLDVTTTNGALTLNANGSYSYVHNGSETTSDSFTYHANDGVANSNVVTVSITVTAVNDNAPVAVADVGTVAEGGTLNVAAAGVLANDTDADGSALTAVLNTTTTNGLLTLNPDGSYSYLHNGSETISDRFTYHANDGIADSNVVTVAVTVTPVNDNAPVAVADTGTVAEGDTLNVAAAGVLGNDTDADGSALTAVLNTTTTNGLLTLNPNGSYSYVHNGSETISDSFTYHANDGIADSNVVTVAITVTPTNDTPAVNDQGFNVTVGRANGTAVGTIVSTDLDAGDTRTVSVTGGTGQTVFAVSAAGAITVANSAGLVEGNLTLNVTVTDAGGLSDTAVITISVQPLRIFSHGFEGN